MSKTEKSKEASTFTVRVGKGTYIVNMYFDAESKDTMQDKVIHIIKNERSA